MKKFALGLVLLITQNGFATSDVSYQKKINTTKGYMRQGLRCENEVKNHLKNGDVNKCLKAISMLEKLSNSNNDKNKYLDSIFYNTGQMYFFGLNNKIKAYEYWYKAARLGHKAAQENLDILCNKSSWACKK